MMFTQNQHVFLKKWLSKNMARYNVLDKSQKKQMFNKMHRAFLAHLQLTGGSNMGNKPDGAKEAGVLRKFVPKRVHINRGLLFAQVGQLYDTFTAVADELSK